MLNIRFVLDGQLETGYLTVYRTLEAGRFITSFSTY